MVDDDELPVPGFVLGLVSPAARAELDANAIQHSAAASLVRVLFMV
jgi:hypothetical protein